MRLEVVNGVERLVVQNGKGTSCEGANKKGTKESRGVSGGDGVDVCPRKVGGLHGGVKNRKDSFKMRAGGDFWDNTTVGGKKINLGLNDVREDFSAVLNKGNGGVVAGSLKTQDNHMRLL